MRTSALATSGCLAMLCNACWTPQHGAEVWQDHALFHSRVVVAESAAGPPLTLWEGSVDRAATDDPMPQAGDVVVFSIDVETPDISVRRYLRLSVGAIFDVDDSPAKVTFSRSATFTMTREESGATRSITRWSDVLPVTIEMFDETGERLSRSRTEDALVHLLATGFFAAARERTEIEVPPEQLDDDDFFRVAMLDGPPMFSIAFLLEEDETLRELAFELIDTSMLWSVVWSFGARFSIQPNYARTERIDREPITGLPGYAIPVQFGFNGRPALRIAVTVVEPFAPLGIAAGVTRVDGFRSTDDRYRFRVRYLPRP